MSFSSRNIQLSVVIPALNEAENLSKLLPEIIKVLTELSITYEIIIIDEMADDQMRRVAQENDAILLSPNIRGYGNSIMAGVKASRGTYIITMDADFSHPPHFIRDLWMSRNKAEVIIASRYVPGGRAIMPYSRYILSRILNLVFSRGLDLNLKDMSSGFRMYHADVINKQSPKNKNFDILQELLVGSLIEGYKISEIPFEYHPRKYGSSHARVFKFGIDYVKSFIRLWMIRNSTGSADYDARAYNTWLLPQRYWQRKRFQYITNYIKNGDACLDVGCGTSKILSALPAGSFAVDILLRKLRFARLYGRGLIQADALSLPFISHSFNCVICSQVIEHIPIFSVLDELDRVLKPGGRLIIGTPDYGKWQWIVTEWLYKHILPQAYTDEHITHYTFKQLREEFVNKRGYKLEDKKYVLQGELILSLIKSLH